MSQCFKCKQGIGTVVSRDGPKTLYCTDCFLHYCTGAVRENALQQCCLASHTPLAVAVSGGPNSLLLLRELGQLRRKMQSQYHRQQPPHLHDRDNKAGAPALLSSSTVSAGAAFDLLPFHLCEAQLVIPPPLPTPPVTTAASAEATQFPATSSVRRAAVEQVRASMQLQFDLLRKLVQQQPPRWVYHDEILDGKKKKRQQQRKKNTMTAGSAETASESPAADATTVSTGGTREEDAVCATQPSPFLYEKSEVRIFQYSDFLPPVYMAEVRHALHDGRLSLTDREALYDRVKQQVLCRAAQRVSDEYRERPRAANGNGINSKGADNEDEEGAAHRTRFATPSPREWYHLVLGDNAARCAVAALAAVVTGAGGDGVVHASAFRGLLHDVVCLRPMRSLLPKETVLCARLHGITGTYTPALRTGTSLRSMHQVLEQFVGIMIVSYRTMIFNVLNTAQKLQVHPQSIQQLVQFAGQVQDREEGNGRKALPGRTAQQNQQDLRAFRPPDVAHRPSQLATAASASATTGDNSNEGGAAAGVAVQCCVCGCPASAPPPPPHRKSAAECLSFAVEMFPLVEPQPGSTTKDKAEHTPSSTGLDCFVCYACRSLLEALPPSALRSPAPTDPLRAVCGLLSHSSAAESPSPQPHSPFIGT
ncbi:hypothetical protein ABB37_07788 [Leptomonas pyrrhocoris]|uniref:Cytoplasmic tRNA 2-thiolation protein 2 n=1 Tax=Leptomonas pyrrhocoris TaxID=157538 RepID=A0A0N1J4G6_LEPPY|nr:hypothetical protein ABB37_07788 [Leptomonas pyrrhocoris]XP_015654917.1 hypothetical protein ABB37_07788 [Leptomonas pyrrhocoris]KPA76477.1 hypothetical protein ABB37_07788 [Leptomonas pyrrhocoris]KPA76478.1 hypothetical protein ABB37_07788 [Leptomonas pyrrhocoris]|eukprot:XP_015654916.1 hypothetical protein ABB37_07788 [Leptomonas pyrrhocoris]